MEAVACSFRVSTPPRLPCVPRSRKLFGSPLDAPPRLLGLWRCGASMKMVGLGGFCLAHARRASRREAGCSSVFAAQKELPSECDLRKMPDPCSLFAAGAALSR